MDDESVDSKEEPAAVLLERMYKLSEVKAGAVEQVHFFDQVRFGSRAKRVIVALLVLSAFAGILACCC